MRTIALVLSLVLGAACDPDAALCALAIDTHRHACERGDADACMWIDQHATAAGTCH